MFNPVPKRKPLKSKKNREKASTKPCVIGFKCSGHVVGHHIKTRGSGGGDEKSNIMCLCFKHHEEIHRIGHKTFFRKYNL